MASVATQSFEMQQQSSHSIAHFVNNKATQVDDHVVEADSKSDDHDDHHHHDFDDDFDSPSTHDDDPATPSSQTSTRHTNSTNEDSVSPSSSPSPSPSISSSDLQIADSIELSRIAVERNILQQISPLKLVKAEWGAWGEVDHTKLEVRGAAYLRDQKKTAASVPMFELLHVDMFYTTGDKQTAFHVASQPGNFAYERQHQLLQLLELQRKQAVTPSLIESEADASTHTGLLSPLVIVNMVYPGPQNRIMNFVSYYQRRFRTAEAMTRHQLRLQQQQQQHSPSSSLHRDYGDDELYEKLNIKRIAAFDRVLQRFLLGTDAQRNACFKILASISEGPWLARKGVGKKPCLLGHKIRQTYHYDPSLNYIEIDADLGSSAFTGPMLKLVKSYTATTVLDVAWILQGDDETELPESLLAATRVDHCHIDDILPRDSPLRSTTTTATTTIASSDN